MNHSRETGVVVSMLCKKRKLSEKYGVVISAIDLQDARRGAIGDRGNRVKSK